MNERVQQVRLHETVVGVLRERSDGHVEFRFADRYRKMEDRPVLGQWFEDDLERLRVHRRRPLLPWFENLLPEGDLRTIVCRQHALEADDVFGLLAAVGRDLPGAVVVGPASEPVSFEGEAVAEGEAHALDGADVALRFSLAGVQLKLSMSQHDDRWTVPVSGMGGDWIAKIARTDRYPGVAENEFATMRWAAEAGFEVPHCEVTTAAKVDGVPGELSGSTSIFMVRRYDRDGSSRIHQEDMAQILGLTPSLKYEQLTYERLGTIVAATLGPAGLIEWLRRLVLMVATANGDAHLKNWSILYRNRITPSWTPLYDQLCTTMYDVDDHLALKLGGSRDWASLDRRRFDWLATRVGIECEASWGLVEGVIHELQAAWRRVANDLPFSDHHRAALLRQWSRVPVLRDAGGLHAK